MARAHRFDLVIPGHHAAWQERHHLVARELRDQGYSGEVVADHRVCRPRNRDRGATRRRLDFILKPFRVSQILNAVKHSLERSHLERENWVLRRTLRPRAADRWRR